MFQYVLIGLVAFSHALPTRTGIFLADPDASETNPDTMEVVQVGSQLFFRDLDGTLISVDQEAPVEKKREKIANMKATSKDGKEHKQPAPAFAMEEPKDYDFMSGQPGVPPKLPAGAFVNFRPAEVAPDTFDFKESPAVSNPASTYLEGGDFDKIPAPKCEMAGCVGPMPNDGSFSLTGDNNADKESCFQTFVPLNGCVGGKGYPMGMLCTICCDCSNDFVTEMKKTVGFKSYKP